MKFRHRSWVSIALMFVVTGSAWAQHRGGTRAMWEPTYEVHADNGVVSIPFELDSNHVIFPIRINGTTFRVVLDTGMPMNGIMLYDTDAVKKLNFAYNNQPVSVGGAGGNGRQLQARLAPGIDIEVGEIQMRNATAIVMPPLAHFYGSHDGVIGFGLFNRFVVRIDNDRSVLEFHEPETFKAPRSSSSVPLDFAANFPYVDIVVTNDDGKEITLNVIVDLGASHAISLNVDEDSAYSAPQRSIRAIIGTGIGGNLDGIVARVKKLELGGQVLTDVVATFPDSNHQRPGGMNDRNGNLGNGILRHFNVTFDYSRDVMILEKNKRFDHPFEWDMSGMRLASPDPDGLQIEALIENSPAARAGLAIGDVLTHVNGKAVSRSDIESLRQMMQSEGSVVRISAIRNGKPLKFELKLRRLV